ncbi:tetratricopeptide repeat protein [Anoxybacillus kestanbolensis]|uniref:tetratricopeptide repeat protein n=1 Tax=Anoxybacillus kestanbolensis TaxID=227476 RepID=UPI00208DD3DD|nr:tetratricopeptide repeat protein [Anoxybacillus kestanbolensis]MCL9971662.1 tetratricopeptide repeat protein [Anoxybacillus kestanbolensis]
MRRLSQMTIDELYDREGQLLEELNSGEAKDWIYHEIVDVYENMYRYLSRCSAEEKEKHGFEYVKKQLVSYLIHYGTYLKTQLKKDERMAKTAFQKALRYDSENPIAHYRLGFLAYKEKEYATAQRYFEKALEYQKGYSNPEFCLNERQLYYAHLYLANSALFVAEKTYQSLEKFPDYISDQEKPAELSFLHEWLQQNENILTMQAFTKWTPAGKAYCSKEECEEIMMDPPRDTVVLYFSDRQNVVAYNGSEVCLPRDPAEMLCYFLVKTNQERPATKYDVEVFFRRRENDEIPTNTFVQKIRRLRERLRYVQVPALIDSCQFRGETAYYYNGSVDYIVMYRSDYTFLFRDEL